MALSCRKKKARAMAVRAADSAAEGHEEIFKLLVDALGPLAVCVRMKRGEGWDGMGWMGDWMGRTLILRIS